MLFWFCFWSVFGFELSHSLLFTQKLWRFSGLSERALDLLLGLCLGVPSISRLFNLDCRYPRDQLQPARQKKRGEHMRVALSGTSSRCFTVSPALISIFWGGFGWFWVCFLFGLCFGFLFGCFVCFLLPPRVRSFDIF